MTTPPSSDPAAGPPTPPPDDDPNQPPQPAEPPSSELVPPVSSSTLMMPGFAAPTPAGSASSIVVPPGDGTLLEFGTGTASADASAAASAPPASSEITGSAIDAALDPAPGTRPGATQATLQSAINTLRQPSGQRLEVGAEIARGGMGAILSVTDQHLRREVAMKVLLPAAARDADRLHRFIEEAQITGQLDHPNIVPVHDIGVMPDGRIYFTMKMVRGASMSRIVRLLRDGDAATVQRYTLGARLNAFRQVCQAVAFAHSRGVVHRDLKPENVMVGDYGEVLLMDWGLARVGLHAATAESARVVHTDRRDAASRGGDTQVASTLDGTVAGTPAYMAPEQAAGDIDQVDSRSDIWALGAILFEMLAWRPPFEGHTGYEIVHKVRTTTPVWPGERETDPPVPRELVAVVQQAMQREKSARYADAGQLIADIDAFLDGRTLAAATYTTRQVLTKWLRRHRAAVIPSAVGAVALLVVGAWFLLTTLQQNAEIARHAAHVEQQRDEIRRERDVADRAHEEAEAARDREADQRVAAERALADVWFERATRAASEARIDEALRDAGRALDAADHAGARALLAAHLPQLPIASCALRARPETLAVSPDGSRLALAMDNGHVSVVRLPSLGPEYDIEVSDAVQIAFSRDAEWLAIGCEDGAASVHDARTGERVCQLQGNDDLITGLAFTFDAEAVITIAFDGTMRLFSALDGTPLAKVTVEGSSSLYALAPAPWNGWVAVGDNRGHVFLFNATTLERELTIRVGDGTVAGIAVSWRRIAVSCRLGDSCRLRVFDTPDLDDVDTEPDEEFEPDFETDLQTPWMGSYLAQLMPPDVASGPMAYGLQLAHDAGDGLALIDLFGDSRPLRVFKPVGDLAIYAMSPDARLAIAAFRVDGAWMLQTHRAGSFFGPDHFTSGTGQVCSLAFDGTDSSLLMLRNSVEAGLCEGRIDCETGWVSPAGMPADSREWCLELYVSADGSRMLAVDHAGPSYVTDRRRTHDYRLTAPGKEQTDDDDDHPRTSAGALSADGYLAALGRPDGTIDFYDLHGDRCTATRRSGHAGKVHAIAISPDGRRAASVDAAGMLRVWDLTAAGAPTELAVRSLDAPLFCAAFSPDSAWLAIGGERPGIALFDMRGSDLPPPVSLDASAQRLLAMAFSPDSSLLIAGGYGGTLLVSDIAARSVIARIPVGDAISALAMRADGLLAVGTAHDDVIRLFRIAALTAPRDRAAQVCIPPADQRLAAATRALELYRADWNEQWEGHRFESVTTPDGRTTRRRVPERETDDEGLHTGPLVGRASAADELDAREMTKLRRARAAMAERYAQSHAAEVRLTPARLAIQQRRFDEAIRMLDELDETSAAGAEHQSTLHELRALACYRAGDFERSLADIDAVLQEQPTLPRAVRARIVVLYALRRYSDAADYVDRVRRSDEDMEEGFATFLEDESRELRFLAGLLEQIRRGERVAGTASVLLAQSVADQAVATRDDARCEADVRYARRLLDDQAAWIDALPEGDTTRQTAARAMEQLAGTLERDHFGAEACDVARRALLLDATPRFFMLDAARMAAHFARDCRYQSMRFLGADPADADRLATEWSALSPDERGRRAVDARRAAMTWLATLASLAEAGRFSIPARQLAPVLALPGLDEEAGWPALRARLERASNR